MRSRPVMAGRSRWFPGRCRKGRRRGGCRTRRRSGNWATRDPGCRSGRPCGGRCAGTRSMPVTSDAIAGLHAEFARRLAVHSDIIDHLQFMHDTVLRYPDPVVIEMGVRTGNSTAALLTAVTRHGHGELWSADLNEPRVPASWHDIPAWHFMQGDSASPGVLAWMPEKADVVFMDTSHTYDQQLAELRAYVPRVRPGGTVLVHDTQCVPRDNFETDSF